MIAGLPLHETVTHIRGAPFFCYAEEGEHVAMNVLRFSDVIWNKTNLTTGSGEFLNLRHLVVEKIEALTSNWESHYLVKHVLTGETIAIVIVAESERDDFKAFLNAIVMSKLNHQKRN